MVNGAQKKILMVLSGGQSATGLELCEATGLRPGTFYPAICQLELDGFVVSWWGDGLPGERRRMYMAKD